MSVYVITGANRGIGLALCHQLHKRGEQVIAVCRQSSAGLDALGVRIEAGVDVTHDADVHALAQRLSGITVDVLINNAGILRRESLDNLDFASLREQFEVNSLAPLRVAHALLPLLTKGGKIAMITSRMGSLTDNTSGAYYGYRMSKAALNMASLSLAHDLKPRQIAVAILHPGYVKTDMTGNSGHIDAHESASGLIARIDELNLQNTGSFWHTNGERLPW